MEVEKRKRFDDGGEVDGKKVKKGSRREADGGEKSAAVAVKRDEKAEDCGDDDGEVEEFFAILRRIHVAVKYFERGNGGSKRKLTAAAAAAAAAPWSPNFEREDFEVVNVVKTQESVEENVGLDLNADPDPDPDTNPDSEQYC